LIAVRLAKAAPSGAAAKMMAGNIITAIVGGRIVEISVPGQAPARLLQRPLIAFNATFPGG